MKADNDKRTMYLYVSDALIQEWKEEAKRELRTLNNFVTHIVSEYIEKKKKERDSPFR